MAVKPHSEELLAFERREGGGGGKGERERCWGGSGESWGTE